MVDVVDDGAEALEVAADVGHHAVPLLEGGLELFAKVVAMETARRCAVVLRRAGFLFKRDLQAEGKRKNAGKGEGPCVVREWTTERMGYGIGKVRKRKDVASAKRPS